MSTESLPDAKHTPMDVDDNTLSSIEDFLPPIESFLEQPIIFTESSSSESLRYRPNIGYEARYIGRRRQAEAELETALETLYPDFKGRSRLDKLNQAVKVLSSIGSGQPAKFENVERSTVEYEKDPLVSTIRKLLKYATDADPPRTAWLALSN
jgi:hypothetical protein